jgi:hypothetical protein
MPKAATTVSKASDHREIGIVSDMCDIEDESDER